MNKKKLTAVITALSCILCLTACASNNTAGNNSSSDETNGSAIQISNKEESKTEEPAPEPSKTEEPSPEPSKTEEPPPEPSKSEEPAPEPSKTEEPSPEPSKTEEPAPEPSKTEEPALEPSEDVNDPNEGKLGGNDIWVSPEEQNAYVYVNNKEEIDKLRSENESYVQAHTDLSLYKSGQYQYQEAKIGGVLKGEMRKLQINELKEFLATVIDREKGFSEYRTETGFTDDVTPIINQWAEWLYQHQPIPDCVVLSMDAEPKMYWPNADTLEDMREEIVIGKLLYGGKILYNTYNDSHELVSSEVIFDPINDICNF